MMPTLRSSDAAVHSFVGRAGAGAGGGARAIAAAPFAVWSYVENYLADILEIRKYKYLVVRKSSLLRAYHFQQSWEMHFTTFQHIWQTPISSGDDQYMVFIQFVYALCSKYFKQIIPPQVLSISPSRALTNESVPLPRRTGGSFVSALDDRTNGRICFRIRHACTLRYFEGNITNESTSGIHTNDSFVITILTNESFP